MSETVTEFLSLSICVCTRACVRACVHVIIKSEVCFSKFCLELVVLFGYRFPISMRVIPFLCNKTTYNSTCRYVSQHMFVCNDTCVVGDEPLYPVPAPVSSIRL